MQTHLHTHTLEKQLKYKQLETRLSQISERNYYVDQRRTAKRLAIVQGHGITLQKRSAPGGQLALKDDSDAKIPKGPKIKEKNLESYKAEPSEKAKESKMQKYLFQPLE